MHRVVKVDGVDGVEKRLIRGLRVLREDLWTLRAAPLPPSVWLRWLPHGLVCLVAFGVAVANADQFAQGYRLGPQFGLLCATAQGVAVALALWRPVPAWWLSTAVTVVVALGARQQMLGPGRIEPPWPWGPPGLVAQCLVLFLLALRLPTRVSAEVLAVTALVTYGLEGVLGGASYTPTGALGVALFAGVVVLGTALRGRRVARHQLVEQAGITAEERARRTLLEERNRIARELHDVVAHHMSVISIQAQVAPHLVENPPRELRENLDGIRQNALEALAELRRVLGVLRSENPDDPYGLGATGGATADAPQPTLDRLDALIENTRAAGLDVVSEVRGPAPVYPPGVQLSAYRIVQEALSNAMRHAPGARVRVELTHRPDGLCLEITNSRPTRPAARPTGAESGAGSRAGAGMGHGLLGMRERAAMLGGRVTAHPTLHGGFCVLAFLPRDGTARPTAPDEDTEPPDGMELFFPDPPPTGDHTP
ncbi:sensor histidine kinase [Streptomyces longwoodensis]|uniref:sensor histidine kinase n=1 Tax=Streptomyces longwoodensis TaxID=68231 RepID=UPI0033D33F5B